MFVDDYYSEQTERIIVLFYVARYTAEILDKSRCRSHVGTNHLWVSGNEIKSDAPLLDVVLYNGIVLGTRLPPALIRLRSAPLARDV